MVYSRLRKLSSQQNLWATLLLNVDIISICYNSSAVVSRMLASLPVNASTILVDNASDDVDATRRIAAEYGSKLIELPTNVGFGSACNLAAQRGQTDFLLFLNPDCVLQPGTLACLIKAADAYPRAVAFNPAIQSATGEEQFKRGSVLLPRDRWLPRGAPSSDRVVPILSGAAMFVRRAAFDRVNGFDPAIFLYHEDDDLSLRLATLGDLMFVRDAVVRHDGGASSPRTPFVSSLKGWHMGRSRVYTARKHGLAFPFTWPLALALAQAGTPALLFSARKRAKNMAFLRGVMSMRVHP